MVLTGKEIKRLVENGAIQISPFDESLLNPNSIDVRLSDVIVRVPYQHQDPMVEMRKEVIHIPPNGLLLMPSELYLGSTMERTYTPRHMPMLHGKSSHARRGLQVHLTAGFGDVGFNGHWTLEIVTVMPFRVYPGMRVAQICFTDIVGEVTHYQGRYQNQAYPTESRSHWDDGR